MAGRTTSGCSFEDESPATVSAIELGHMSSTEVGAETGTGKFAAQYSARAFGITCKYSTSGETGAVHFKINTAYCL